MKSNIMKRIKDYWNRYIKFLFIPDYWSMNYPYSWEVDIIIEYLMKYYDFEKVDDFTYKLGDTIIWTENRPYAAIRLYAYDILSNYRPSRYTIYKALKRIRQIERDEIRRQKAFDKYIKHVKWNLITFCGSINTPEVYCNNTLKEKLDKAINQENYELAAEIRDEINKRQ